MFKYVFFSVYFVNLFVILPNCITSSMCGQSLATKQTSVSVGIHIHVRRVYVHNVACTCDYFTHCSMQLTVYPQGRISETHHRKYRPKVAYVEKDSRPTCWACCDFALLSPFRNARPYGSQEACPRGQAAVGSQDRGLHAHHSTDGRK